jgi:hypothetical protein
MDAECFRPERWDEDLPLFKDKTTHNYGYLPFSGGPRICLGSKFGTMSFGANTSCLGLIGSSGLCPRGSCVYCCQNIPALPKYSAPQRRTSRSCWC